MENNNKIFSEYISHRIQTLAKAKQDMNNKVRDLNLELKNKKEMVAKMEMTNTILDLENHEILITKQYVEAETSALVNRYLDGQKHLKSLSERLVLKQKSYEEDEAKFKKSNEADWECVKQFQELYKSLPKVQEIEKIDKELNEVQSQLQEHENAVKADKLARRTREEEEQHKFNQTITSLVQSVTSNRKMKVDYLKNISLINTLESTLAKLKNEQELAFINFKQKLADSMKRKEYTSIPNYLAEKDNNVATSSKSDFQFVKPALPLKNPKKLIPAKNLEASNTNQILETKNKNDSGKNKKVDELTVRTVKDVNTKAKVQFGNKSRNPNQDNLDTAKRMKMSAMPSPGTKTLENTVEPEISVPEKVVVEQINEDKTNVNDKNEISVILEEKSNERCEISVGKNNNLLETTGEKPTEVEEMINTDYKSVENEDISHFDDDLSTFSPLSVTTPPDSDWEMQFNKEETSENQGENAVEINKNTTTNGFMGFFEPSAKGSKSFFSLF